VTTAVPDELLEAVSASDDDREVVEAIRARLRGLLEHESRGGAVLELRRLAATLRAVGSALERHAAQGAGRQTEAVVGDAGWWLARLARSVAVGEPRGAGPLPVRTEDELDELLAARGAGEPRPSGLAGGALPATLRAAESLRLWRLVLDETASHGAHEIDRGAPLPEALAGDVRDAVVIARAARSRLAAGLGLAWLADHEAATADERGAGSPWGAIALAARALDRDELNDAEGALQAAATAWPGQPEPLLGLALVAERRELWSDAAGFFQQAAALCAGASDPLARLRAAISWLRPGAAGEPAGAYLSLAKVSQERGVEPGVVVDLLDRGLSASAPDGSPWSLDGRVMRAGLLEHGKAPGAGEALASAADAYERAGRYDLAVDLTRRAIAAGNSAAVTAWHLVERMRLADLASQQRFAEVVATWESGRSRELPSRDTAWALLTRALASDLYRGPRRRDELAATLLFGEWAVLLNDGDGQLWAFLARFYRTVCCELTAVHASRRALALSPGSTLALEESAAILANLGLSEQALATLARLDGWPGDRAWRDEVRGYLYANLGRDEDALAVLGAGASWSAPVLAAVLWRLGHEDRARETYRQVYADPARPANLRAIAAIWLGEPELAEQVLASQSIEADDDPTEVMTARTWVAAALGRWDDADALWTQALGLLRVPRHVTLLTAELRDTLGLLARGGGAVEAARRGAAWAARLADRAATFAAEFTLDDEAAARREREELAGRMRGTPYEGFAAVRALREAADTGAVTEAAGRVTAEVHEYAYEVTRSRAGVLVGDGDAALARDELDVAARCYERAGALADLPDLGVRRCWVAAVARRDVAAVDALAERVVWGDPAAVLAGLCARLSIVQGWRAVLAFDAAGRATGNHAWRALAEHCGRHVARSLEVTGDATLPPALALEIPAGAFRELSNDHPLITASLPAARRELMERFGVAAPPSRVTHGAAGVLRVLVDGIAVRRVELSAVDDEAATAALVAREAQGVVAEHAARWLDAQRIDEAIARWPRVARAAVTRGSSPWFGDVAYRPRLLAAFQAAARERLPSAALGEAMGRQDSEPAEPSVFAVIRNARALRRDWLRDELLVGRVLVTLPVDLEATLLPAITEEGLRDGTFAIEVARRDSLMRLAAVASGGEPCALRVRDPGVRFVVALILATMARVVPVFAEEELG